MVQDIAVEFRDWAKFFFPSPRNVTVNCGSSHWENASFYSVIQRSSGRNLVEGRQCPGHGCRGDDHLVQCRKRRVKFSLAREIVALKSRDGLGDD
jgi:hypothetical protein